MTRPEAALARDASELEHYPAAIPRSSRQPYMMVSKIKSSKPLQLGQSSWHDRLEEAMPREKCSMTDGLETAPRSFGDRRKRSATDVFRRRHVVFTSVPLAAFNVNSALAMHRSIEGLPRVRCAWPAAQRSLLISYGTDGKPNETKDDGKAESLRPTWRT